MKLPTHPNNARWRDRGQLRWKVIGIVSTWKNIISDIYWTTRSVAVLSVTNSIFTKLRHFDVLLQANSSDRGKNESLTDLQSLKFFPPKFRFKIFHRKQKFSLIVRLKRLIPDSDMFNSADFGSNLNAIIIFETFSSSTSLSRHPGSCGVGKTYLVGNKLDRF